MTAPTPEPRRRSLHVDDEVAVGRPPPDVFAFLSDPQHLPAWRAGIKRASRTSGPSIGVGTTYLLQGTLAGRPFEATYEVTAYEPVESFSARMTTSRLALEETYGLDGSDAPTVVRVGVTAEPHGRLAVLTPLLRLALRRRLRADLRRLGVTLAGPAPPEPEPEPQPEATADPEPETEPVADDALPEDETAPT